MTDQLGRCFHCGNSRKAEDGGSLVFCGDCLIEDPGLEDSDPKRHDCCFHAKNHNYSKYPVTWDDVCCICKASIAREERPFGAAIPCQ